MARVDAWGGNANRLLDVPPVKQARRLEGLVLLAGQNAQLPNPDGDFTMADATSSDVNENRELLQLRTRLEVITKKREGEVRGVGGIQGRLKLLEIATQRSESSVETCGFDSRLYMDEVEWVTWIEGEGREVLQLNEANDDGDWCTGKRKCERHAG